MLLADVSWDGEGDGTSCTDRFNWSGDAVPVAVDDVTITAAANPHPIGLAIKQAWLRVMARANATTGLTAPDVFYFGNLIGEAGNGTRSPRVDVVDLALVRSTFGSVAARPAIPRFDFHRDGRVNAVDLGTARANHGRSLPLFSVARVIATPSAPADSAVWSPPQRRNEYLREVTGPGVLS